MAQAALRSYPALRETSRSAGCSSTPRRRSSRRSRAGSASTRRGGSQRRGVEIHVGTTLESYDGREAVLANGTRIPARTLVWTAGVRASPLARRSSALPLDERGRVVVDETLRVEGVRRHLGARRLRRRAEHEDAGRRRPADVPARAPPGAAAREEPHRRRRSRTATGCSARSRRSDASRGSRRSPGSTSGASPAGSSRGRTTCTSSRSSRGSCASSSTGPSRSSSAATSSSSRCSAIRRKLGE